MEVIAKPKGADIDKLAEKVFLESINILGGLKNLIQYRNLTWLPSLAEASYVVVLKNEAIKTSKEIAKELGITDQTVKNILSADEEKVKKFLEGELEEIDEHKAGGIAKLAYKKLKREGKLEEVEEEKVVIKKDEIEVLGIDWAVHVLAHIKGLNFPIENKQPLLEKIGKIVAKGVKLEEILDKIEYPVKSPAELLHKIKKVIEQK